MKNFDDPYLGTMGEILLGYLKSVDGCPIDADIQENTLSRLQEKYDAINWGELYNEYTFKSNQEKFDLWIQARKSMYSTLEDVEGRFNSKELEQHQPKKDTFQYTDLALRFGGKISPILPLMGLLDALGGGERETISSDIGKNNLNSLYTLFTCASYFAYKASPLLERDTQVLREKISGNKGESPDNNETVH